MGDVINLNKARKDRNKAARSAQSAQNRVAHGQTKAERNKVAAQTETLRKTLDGARRDSPDQKD